MVLAILMGFCMKLHSVVVKDVCLRTRLCAKSFQLCLTFCSPMDCRLPGSSVHGILQARILEWLAMSFFRASSQLRD